MNLTNMESRGLIKAFIRKTTTPSEIFFVIDKTNFDNEKRSFWNKILADLRATGFEVCVGNQKLWSRTEKLWGWEYLLL